MGTSSRNGCMKKLCSFEMIMFWFLILNVGIIIGGLYVIDFIDHNLKNSLGPRLKVLKANDIKLKKKEKVNYIKQLEKKYHAKEMKKKENKMKDKIMGKEEEWEELDQSIKELDEKIDKMEKEEYTKLKMDSKSIEFLDYKKKLELKRKAADQKLENEFVIADGIHGKNLDGKKNKTSAKYLAANTLVILTKHRLEKIDEFFKDPFIAQVRDKEATIYMYEEFSRQEKVLDYINKNIIPVITDLKLNKSDRMLESMRDAEQLAAEIIQLQERFENDVMQGWWEEVSEKEEV